MTMANTVIVQKERELRRRTVRGVRVVLVEGYAHDVWGVRVNGVLVAGWTSWKELAGVTFNDMVKALRRQGTP